MIDEALRPVVQAEAKLAANTDSGNDLPPQRNRYSGNSVLQPARAGRPDGAVSGAILERSREPAEQMRHGDQPADAGWANIARRIQQFRNQAKMMQFRMQPHPVERLRARNDLDRNARFLEKRGRLQRTLPCAKHDHPLALELAQITVIAGMGSQGGRDPGELGGTIRE